MFFYLFFFVGLLLSPQRFAADQNCDEYPCTQNLPGNHSNCCVVALSHPTLGGCLLGQSGAEITYTPGLSLTVKRKHTQVGLYTVLSGGEGHRSRMRWILCGRQRGRPSITVRLCALTTLLLVKDQVYPQAY